jgi:hypothetical protein
VAESQAVRRERPAVFDQTRNLLADVLAIEPADEVGRSVYGERQGAEMARRGMY